MELTTKRYWQDYYESSPEDRNIILKVCGRYDGYYEQLVSSCSKKPESILEIGAFPGRYLGYLSFKYNLKATGLDFNPDVEKFNRSMRIMGIEEFDYVCSDFLAHTPSAKFDLVFSNGFVEHFTNYDDVLDKHVQYLNSGGAMMIMIPNKRFLRRLYGFILDYKNLKAHNLHCMRLRTFRDFAKRNGLHIRLLSYDGGFAYKVHHQLSFLQKPLYKIVRFLAMRLEPYLKRKPSKWYSGTIVAILSKNA